MGKCGRASNSLTPGAYESSPSRRHRKCPSGSSLRRVISPGPSLLGRSVVIRSGTSPPCPWAETEQYVIDSALLADQTRLGEMVNELQRRYVNRIPTVYGLKVFTEDLSKPETTDAPPYELDAAFSFLRERLAKAVWHNSYDARSDPVVWWWAHKAAARLGVTIEGPADVVADDGTPMWIDGGPRQPIDIDGLVVHHESVEIGRATPVPSMIAPEADLAEDQLDAVSHVVGPARVIAPAGSGKTRVLTERVRHLIEDRGVEPSLVTALAYNRRAAQEMVDRLPGGDVLNVRTIHSIGWEILRMAKPGLRLIDEAEQRRRLEPITAAPPRASLRGGNRLHAVACFQQVLASPMPEYLTPDCPEGRVFPL